MLSVTGFLLSYIKYGDNDCVLHCFTKEKGFQSFFVRGIYSKKNKKKAYLLPLAELGLTVDSRHKSQTLLPVSKIDLVENPDFYQNVKASAVVFFVADFLNQVLRHEHPNSGLYSEILLFLDELEKNHYQSYLVFLLQIVKNSGILPLSGDEKFLDPETGTYLAAQSHPLFGEDVSALWKRIISSETPYGIQIRGSVKKVFLDSLLVYCHYHVTDFRTPASLDIVKQIFAEN
jgi:DNA repair protein RecO (recombination protein O)